MALLKRRRDGDLSPGRQTETTPEAQWGAEPRYDAVIFDLDGTLVDTLPWFLSQLDNITDRFGIRRVIPSEIDGMRNLGARDLIRRLRIPMWKLPAISAYVRELAQTHVRHLQVFPGVYDMLSTLDAHGVRLGVVSSSSEANIRTILAPAIETISSVEGSVSLFGKARRLRKAARDLGAAPAFTLCVGDEIRDAIAARKAGMPFGAVGWGMTHEHALRAKAPAVIFQTVEDLCAIRPARRGASQ